ncbi:MAG: hypothetical protein JNN33_03275 [Rhodospirillaceae bacterium]|jgi:hypothetical protein|nr:hypothetical protein [Rhodospirillaceae bacterium]
MLKLNLLSMALLMAASSAPLQAQSTMTTPSQPGCHYGEVVDGTTADDAKRRIEAAGYSHVINLKKSCDNFWHGRATLNGVETNVLVTPDGRVRPEGD